MGYLRCFMKRLLYLLFIFLTNNVIGQKDSLQISFYVEPYYSIELGDNTDHNRHAPIYCYNRQNEVDINLGLIQFAFKNNKTRANLGIGAGTYMQANYVNEQDALKYVFEGNAGMRLGKKELWLDAGILPSHIGFESAIGSTNINLSRSILAENTPYYEAGVRISYTSINEKLFVSMLMLNGWQKIRREDQNQIPSFGHQISYKFSDNFLINWSTYAGIEIVDSLKQNRLFSNLYFDATLGTKWRLMAGWDIGTQQLQNGGKDTQKLWHSSAICAQYHLHPNWDINARAEFYHDHDMVILTDLPDGTSLYGATVGVDYKVLANFLWRFEYRNLISNKNVFYIAEEYQMQNNALTTSWTYKF